MYARLSLHYRYSYIVATLSFWLIRPKFLKVLISSTNSSGNPMCSLQNMENIAPVPHSITAMLVQVTATFQLHNYHRCLLHLFLLLPICVTVDFQYMLKRELDTLVITIPEFFPIWLSQKFYFLK